MSYGQTYANDMFAINASESARAGFLQKTYLHLFGAILAFIGIEALFFNFLDARAVTALMFGNGIIGVLLVMGMFIAAGQIASYWAHNSTSSVMQYAGLGLYTLAEAVIMFPILGFAMRFQAQSGVPIITMAGVITMLTFGGLTVIVLVSGADFSFLRSTLIMCGWAAMVTIICAVIFQFNLGILFSGAMIALMCGYILFYTSQVLHNYRTDQHVGAALELFSCVATLFFYILRILLELYGAFNRD